MNKIEFISELIKLYDDFNEKNKPARIKAYNVVLNDDVNYNKLYIELMQTYKSFNFAPSPAHLFELVEKEKLRLASERYEQERIEREEKERKREEQEEMERQKKQIPLTAEERERIKEIQMQIKNFKFGGEND